MLPKMSGVLVEVGSGEGQLTVLFANMVPQYKIIPLVRFRGTYSENKARLLSEIARNRLKTRFKVVTRLPCLADGST